MKSSEVITKLLNSRCYQEDDTLRMDAPSVDVIRISLKDTCFKIGIATNTLQITRGTYDITLDMRDIKWFSIAPELNIEAKDFKLWDFALEDAPHADN